MSNQPKRCTCVRRSRPITDDNTLLPDWIERCQVCGGLRGGWMDGLRLPEPRRETSLKALDLSVCTDPTVPACPGCKSRSTFMLETTSGKWQLVCTDCMKRWGSDWKPAKDDDDGRC